MAEQLMPADYRQGLNMALAGELKDARTYEYMASIAPNAVLAQRMQDFSNDESTHANIILGMMPVRIEGQPPQAENLHQQEFWAMAREAYRDEVHGVMMYAHLSLMAPNMAAAARLRDIMRDEMTHAEFFAALLMTR